MTLSSLLILPKFYDLFAEATSVRTFRASLRDFSHFCGTYKKIHDLIGILQKNYTFLPISLINESFLNFFSYLCTVLRLPSTIQQFLFTSTKDRCSCLSEENQRLFQVAQIRCLTTTNSPLTRIPTDTIQQSHG